MENFGPNAYFFVFGRSPRTSRNSRGPLMRLRLRCARSSLVAPGSPSRSIVRPAISTALRLLPALSRMVGVATASACSRSRRIASG